MTWAVIGLCAAYALLGALLLSLNLRSAWRWQVKAAAIVVTASFFVLAFAALQAMLGWPTDGRPPASFQLHAALVEEPDRKGPGQGAIYLWLSRKDRGGASGGPPRAHALPYSRALHEEVARAKARLDDGLQVDGRARSAPREDGGLDPSLQIELFEAPPARLPPKPAG